MAVAIFSDAIRRSSECAFAPPKGGWGYIMSGISGLSFDSPSLSLVSLPTSPALAVLVIKQGRFTRRVSEVSSFCQKFGLFFSCMALKQLTRRWMIVKCMCSLLPGTP